LVVTPETALERFFQFDKPPQFLARRAAICRKAGEGQVRADAKLAGWDLFDSVCRRKSLSSNRSDS
jgi:hypothetical protein